MAVMINVQGVPMLIAYFVLVINVLSAHWDIQSKMKNVFNAMNHAKNVQDQNPMNVLNAMMAILWRHNQIENIVIHADPIATNAKINYVQAAKMDFILIPPNINAINAMILAKHVMEMA